MHYKIFGITLRCYICNCYCLKIIIFLIFDYLRNLRNVKNLCDYCTTVILVIVYQIIVVLLSTKLLFKVEEVSCLRAWARKSLSRFIEQGSLLSVDLSGSFFLGWLSIKVSCKCSWAIYNLFGYRENILLRQGDWTTLIWVEELR